MTNPCELSLKFIRRVGDVNPCELPLKFGEVTEISNEVPVELCLFSQTSGSKKLEWRKDYKLFGQCAESPVVYSSDGGGLTVRCADYLSTPPQRFSDCVGASFGGADEIARHNDYLTNAPDRWSDCVSPEFGGAEHNSDCVIAAYEFAEPVAAIAAAMFNEGQPVADCIAVDFSGEFVNQFVVAMNSETEQPKCEYRVIITPKPPKPPGQWVCGWNRDPHELSFNLNFAKTQQVANQLPFNFSCNRTATIPILGAYIVLNTTQVKFNGNAVEFLSANINTDTNSWCWSCSVTVPPATFELLNINGRKEDNPAIIDVTINGYQWRFMLEDFTDSRSFGQKTYTLSGRSTTAQLSLTHIAARTKTFTAAQSARQLIESELNLLPVTIDQFLSVDWLVPANTYSYSNQTPMAVINDIASAAGCYVESHRTEPKISIKKRLPVAIWNVATANVDKSIPSSIITNISGQRQISQRCNGVKVIGQANGKIIDAKLNGTDGTPTLDNIVHPLITAEEAGRQRAIQALSATGRHKQETLTMPLSSKYGAALAELGELWEVAETNAWRGQVIGVSVSAEFGKVTQQVTLDRYLGEGE